MPTRSVLKRPLSFRAVLFVFTGLQLLPALAIGVFLLLRYSDAERTRAEEQLAYSARGVAQLVDAQFVRARTALRVLAASPLLESGDLASFETLLRRVTAETGRVFGLTNRAGQLLINTSSTPGAPLPSITEQGRDEPVFRSASFQVSNVTTEAVTGHLAAVVGVPVSRDGTVQWSLNALLSAENFRDILANRGVPEEWVVSITDRNGRHLVRSHNNEQFAGKPLVPKLVEHLRTFGAGTLQTVTLEGIPVTSTIARAPESEWVVAIGLPMATLTAPLRRQLQYFAISGAVLLAAMLAVSWLLASYLARGAAALAHDAERLARGAILEPTGWYIREADTIARAMEHASVQLRKRSAELQSAYDGLESQVAARTKELAEKNDSLLAERQARERSEEQLRHSQKMEAIGQLTGGIAHDFNNMLAVVISSFELTKRRLARGEADFTKFIEPGVDAARRAADLTKRLLAFARQQPLSPKAADVNKCLLTLSEILQRTVGENIRFETVLAGGLWKAHVDLSALDNAIVNLAANARDAMPDGGKLTIETSNAHLDEAYSASHAEVIAGQYILIAITDNGAGMSPAAINKAFDPFYTTKPDGKGTGLGLAQVYGFIKQSGGHAKIYSEPGHGTTVKLYLPRYTGFEDSTQAPEAVRSAPLGTVQETILLVEDDERVRLLSIASVRELGYTVLEADGAVKALRLLDAHPEIALLFTDIVMPDVNGRKLADEARRRRPKLKVLFTTGFTRNAIIHNGMLDRGVNFIAKPYNLVDLASKLRQILDDPP